MKKVVITAAVTALTLAALTGCSAKDAPSTPTGSASPSTSSIERSLRSIFPSNVQAVTNEAKAYAATRTGTTAVDTAALKSVTDGYDNTVFVQRNFDDATGVLTLTASESGVTCSLEVRAENGEIVSGETYCE